VSDLWVWVLLYAVALAGLYLLVYYYYIRQNDQPTIAASATGETNRSSKQFRQLGSDEDGPENTDPITSTDPPGRRCRHCGTVNCRDPMFRYCRECGQELSY
jgi:hypothetical protein